MMKRTRLLTLGVKIAVVMVTTMGRCTSAQSGIDTCDHTQMFNTIPDVLDHSPYVT